MAVPPRLLTIGLALALLAGACASAPNAPGSAASPTSIAPSAKAVAERVAPTGATASVDDATWALAARIAAPTYTADTTSAFESALARAGVAVVPDTSTDPATAVPEIPLTGVASPFGLLDFQAHALAVGAWAGATWSGAELDSVVPLPEGLTGVPPTSALLAAYVATADSPGGSLSRALMAGQDLLQPATLQFPAVVLVLFVSDLATDGGRVAPPVASPSGASQAPTGLLAIARNVSDTPSAKLAIDLGTICAGPDGWIDAIIAKLEAALTPTTTSVVGTTLVGAFHWLVHVAVAVVKGVVDAITAPILAAVRSIAVMISAVSVEIASLLPYSVHVVATGGQAGGATFRLGSDPQRGAYTVLVSAGDLPDWPGPIAECATAAGVPLPDFTPKGVPVTFEPIDAPGDPLLSPTDQAVSNTVTDASGQASWPFLTSRDPGDATGEQKNQFDYMHVAVHRPELDDLRAKLTNALFGGIPGLIRPYVVAVFKPLLDTLQDRLNKLLDARGTGAAVLVFHAKVPPTPSPSAASPSGSGACAVTLSPGTYQGTLKFDATTIVPPGQIDLGESGVTNDHATGPLSVTVASDGTLTGSFHLLLETHQVYSGLAAGTEDTTVQQQGAGVGGTLCNPMLTFASETITGCQATGHGTCGAVGQTISLAGLVPALPMGAPTSVGGTALIWSISVENSVDAGFGGLSSEIQSTTTMTLNR